MERAGKNNRNKTEREKKFLGGKQERERMRMEQTAERESPEAENFQLFDAQWKQQICPIPCILLTP